MWSAAIACDDMVLRALGLGRAPRLAQTQLDLLAEVVDRDPDLGQAVAIAQRHSAVLERLVVDGEGPRGADLVLAAVAAADGTALVVLGLNSFAQVAVDLPRQLRLAVLANQRQDRDLDRRQSR